MEETNISPETLKRPDWNSLKANYTLHDIAEAYFKGRVNQIGLHTEQWGIDMRGNDENLIFDNKMDLRLWEPKGTQDEPDNWPDSRQCDSYYANGQWWLLRSLVDVKSKSSQSWMGKMNLRHLVNYAEWARRYDVPVFVYFTIVDTDSETVGDENVLIPIEPFERLDEYLEHFNRNTNNHIEWRDIVDDCDRVTSTFKYRDGNAVIEFDEEYYENFDWFVENVL